MTSAGIPELNSSAVRGRINSSAVEFGRLRAPRTGRLTLSRGCPTDLEWLDAELSETDDQGRLVMYGEVATVAVVGNEDGAHKVIADVLQALMCSRH